MIYVRAVKVSSYCLDFFSFFLRVPGKTEPERRAIGCTILV